MRRHVTIPARSAVAATLLMTGAILVVAEVRQTMLRRFSVETNSVEPAAAAGLNRLDDNSGPSLPQTAAAKPVATPAKQDDELAAEQQAATVPGQKPPKKSAKKDDAHTRQVVISVIISIPDRRLALLEDGELVKVYSVAVGTDETPSPDGEFTIINHVADPAYYHEGIEIAPGKNNPLGTRWMGLSLKGYGIHGTNVQSSVGKAASHGCFRMKKKDVEELYARVQVGDKVSIRGERDELTASLFTANANTVVVATNAKADTQIASAATVSATTDEEQ